MPKRTSKISTFRSIREEYGYDLVVLRSFADANAYTVAVEDFTRDGDRAALVRNLFALGLAAGQVRWHAANRGAAMIGVY